jgi:biotin-dependent carboxylase-like uncharacterized protein
MPITDLLKITKANFSALFTDRGRVQQQSLGLTQSGPMDEYAFLWANKLLGNDLNAACIEITFGKFSVKALQRCQVAITGANFNARLNQHNLANWETLYLKEGDELHFDGPQMNGTRAYLAIKGGFDCPKPFQSACTVKRENLGGFNDGEALKIGDKLSSLVEQTQAQTVNISVYPELIRAYNNRTTIHCRFIPSCQWPLFSRQDQQHFLNQIYRINSQSDRMGVRLEGEKLKPYNSGIISEGIALGAIQVPPDGQPIVLMRDRQTIGGYPKLGTVLSTDVDKIGQAMPGQKIQFHVSDIKTAYEERVQRELFFDPHIER